MSSCCALIAVHSNIFFCVCRKKRHFNLLIFHNMAVKEREKVITCTSCGWWWKWDSWTKVSSMLNQLHIIQCGLLVIKFSMINNLFFLSNGRKFSISCSSPCKLQNFRTRFTKCWWNLNVFHKFISLHTSMTCLIPKLITFHYNFRTDFSIFSLLSRQPLCSSRQLFLIEWWKFFLYAFQLNISHFHACCHAPLKSPKSSLPSTLARR